MLRLRSLALLVLLAVAPAAAQTKKVLSTDDYTKWRTIGGADLSPDGNWASYIVRFANTLTPDAKPVLHLRNLTTNQEVEVPHVTTAIFSPDSRWVAYQVEPPPPAKGGRGAAADSTAAPAAPGIAAAPANGRGAAAAPKQEPKRWELRELATGKLRVWQNVQSARFSPTSSHLLLRRNPAGSGASSGGSGGAASAPAGPNAARGVDAVLHELATGRSQFLGSMGDAEFNRAGDLLAYTVDAAVRDGNGLFLINLRNGRSDVLDNDSLRYASLAWNARGTGLAILKGHAVEKMRDRDNTLIVFADIATALAAPTRAPTLLDPTASGFPKGFVISERSSLSWSDDGRLLFLGIMPQTAAPDTAKKKSTDSIADVDVWRTQDERIQSAQMIGIEGERNRTFRQAFDVAGRKYITLTDSGMREIELPLTGTWAVGQNPMPYISDYKPATADIYRVNLLTGERTLMFKEMLTGRFIEGISPDGRTFLYWKDGAWQAYTLAAMTSRALAPGSGSIFANQEFDNPGPRPSYGIAGWSSDGSAVIAQSRFDLWALPLDGAPARNVTLGVGAREKIVLRQIRTEQMDSTVRSGARLRAEIDLAKPITLSAYGEFSKKGGFYRLANGQMTQLVLDDAAYSTPSRADKSDRFLFTRQSFVDFPDLRISGRNFADATQITDINPQRAEYQWGRRVVFDYVTRRGDSLQGILALPDDYKAGEKRPMIVTFYEKNSQTANRYPMPSFITGMGSIPIEATSRGYITMLPDVFFHTGSSHSDMLDAVEAATEKVIAMGYADPKHIGVHGHSYGGEGAAFIGTRSKLFAAVGMGAGVTDLYSDFSQSWGWTYQVSGGSGANGNGYYMYGQGRWGFSPWEKPEVYHYESALTHVPDVTVPFLIMHGTADPTVSFTEGMNFYNALRFNGKNAIMLAYPGEGHGLRGLANRKDLTIRYFQFFDHYLKGVPAPKWMTDGVPFIAKETMREPK